MKKYEFQKCLQELSEIAAQHDHYLHAGQLRSYFSDVETDREVLLQILHELQKMGITIIQDVEIKDTKDNSQNKEHALNAEEENYLSEHLRSLDQVTADPEQIDALFSILAKGDSSAASLLSRIYLPIAARMAADMHDAGMLLQDLIAEAELLVLTAFAQPQPAQTDDASMRSYLRSGIRRILDANNHQKFADDRLVERVEKLDQALEQLKEEDGTTGFGLGELTILLDMSEEELRDTLKLTGEDV